MFCLVVCEWFVCIVKGGLCFSCYDFSVFVSVWEVAYVCVVVDEDVSLLFAGWNDVVFSDRCV